MPETMGANLQPAGLRSTETDSSVVASLELQPAISDQTANLSAGIVEPEAAPIGASRMDLDRKFISGVAWTTSAKWLSQIATWAITLIVARLLAPSDYGMFGMAMVYIGLATLFSEFGLGTAIIALRDLTDDQISQLNTASILLGCVSFGISVAVAGPIGHFFKAPGLPMVIVVISVAFLTSAFRTVPYALLTKEMRFKLMAGIDGFQGAAQSLTSLLLAFLGCGYWALAVGMVSSSVASTGLTLAYRRQRFAWPRRSTLLEPLRYSRDIIVSQLSWYLYDSSDFLIAGRVLGEAPLGAYTIAWTLAHVPLDKLTFIVNRLTPSLFSAVQTESEALRRYLRTITEGLSLIICPATIGILLVAHDFVYVALGQKWLGVVLPLELLALHAFIRSNIILLAPVLNVTGGTRFGMWMNLLSVAILPASFYFGSRWGTVGIAAVWVVIYPVVQLPLFWRVFRAIGMSAREYLVSLWPAVSACTLMTAAIEILKVMVVPGWPATARLVVEILSGLVVYLSALSLMHRERFLIFLNLARSLAKREPRKGLAQAEPAGAVR